MKTMKMPKIAYKKIKELPTTNILKYLSSSKLSQLKSKSFSKQQDNSQSVIQRQNKDLTEQIISIVENMTKYDQNNPEINPQINQFRKDNQHFREDLKKSIANSKQINASPMQIFHSLIKQYEEKGYKIPNFNPEHNLFSLNPLIDTQKHIKHFYKDKFANKEYIKDLNDYKEKNKEFLVKMNVITQKLQEKNKSMKPGMRKTSDVLSQLSSDYLSHYRIKTPLEPFDLKLEAENNTLKDYNKLVMKTIEYDNASLSNTSCKFHHKNSSPCHNIFRNNHLSSLKHHMNLTISNTTNHTNTSSMTPKNRGIIDGYNTKNIKQFTSKSIRKTTMTPKSFSRPDHSTYIQYNTEPSPLTKADIIQRNIMEKERHEVISDLYEYTKEADYSQYRKCLLQYFEKYGKKGIASSIATHNKTSQSFAPDLNSHFIKLRNNINDYNEREACITCYSRINKKDQIECQVNKLEHLDNQLKKFNYVFIKKKIINEKTD